MNVESQFVSDESKQGQCRSDVFQGITWTSEMPVVVQYHGIRYKTALYASFSKLWPSWYLHFCRQVSPLPKTFTGSVLCPPLALFSGVLQYFFPLVYSFHVNLSPVTSLLFGICLGYLIHADYPYGQLSPTPWMDTRWRGSWADHARRTALGSNPWPVAIYNSSLPSCKWKGSSPTTWSLHGIR